eukprot:gene4003-2129_t
MPPHSSTACGRSVTADVAAPVGPPLPDHRPVRMHLRVADAARLREALRQERPSQPWRDWGELTGAQQDAVADRIARILERWGAGRVGGVVSALAAVGDEFFR